MTSPADSVDLLRCQLQALREAGAVEATLGPGGELLRVVLGPVPLDLPRSGGQQPPPPQGPIPERPGASVAVRPR